MTECHFLFTFCGGAGRVLEEWAEFGGAGGVLHLLFLVYDTGALHMIGEGGA